MFDKSDKMHPCDVLLAEAMETFSPKSDHSMQVNCEGKYSAAQRHANIKMRSERNVNSFNSRGECLSFQARVQ